ETQVINIMNVESGTFNIIIQNAVVTSDLSYSSTASQIQYALDVASQQISSSKRECSYFAVTQVAFTNNNQNMFITVQFEVDNSAPLTLLNVYTPGLVGNNVTTF